MAIETFNYLDSLNVSNPPTSDGLVGGDDHIRGIKATLKNSFPSITGAVTATHTQINNAVAATINGVTRFAIDHCYNDNTSGLNFPASNLLDIVVAGATPVRFNSSTLGATFFGPISATSFAGAGVVPVGGTLIWWSDILPSTSDFAWCNGQAVSRAANPILFSILGTTYGAGNGTTTFNLPNLCEVVPVGRSQMGGVSSPGFLSTISDGLKAILNGVFGTQAVALSTSELPSHTHNNTLNESPHSHTGGVVSTTAYSSPGGATAVVQAVSVGQTGSTSTGITITNAAAGGGAAHTNVQPSRAVNWIIRLG